MKNQQQLGTRWLHIFYTLAPLRAIASLYYVIISFLLFDTGGFFVLLIYGLSLFFIHVSLFTSYMRNRYIGIYPHWMYRLTLIGSWLMLSPLYVFLHNPYIKRRSYLFPKENCLKFANKTHENDDFYEASEPPIQQEENPKLEENKIQSKKQERKNAMVPLLRGVKVKHFIYGIGLIVHDEGRIITVRFADKTAKFMYPDAFNQRFLTLTTEDIPQAIRVAEGVPTKNEPQAIDLVQKAIAESTSQASIPTEKIFEAIHNAKRPDWVTTYKQSVSIKQFPALHMGYLYGTRAKDIYLAGCDVFGWDRSLAGKMGPQQKLYAYHATEMMGKKVSVWVLRHHCWVAPVKKRSTSNWWNVITRDAVYEEWQNPKDGFYSDFSTRLTFAYSKWGYVYIGIFKPYRLIEAIDPADGEMKYIKCYQRTGDNYKAHDHQCL